MLPDRNNAACFIYARRLSNSFWSQETGNIRSRRIPRKVIRPSCEDTALVKPVVAPCRQFRPGCEKGHGCAPKPRYERLCGKCSTQSLPHLDPAREGRESSRRKQGGLRLHPPCGHSSRKCRLQGVFRGFSAILRTVPLGGLRFAIFQKGGLHLTMDAPFCPFYGLRYSRADQTAPGSVSFSSLTGSRNKKYHLPPRGFYAQMVEGGTCHDGRSKLTTQLKSYYYRRNNTPTVLDLN